MFPFALPLWETDATLRAAVQESVQMSATSLGTGALLSGGDLSFDARAAAPRAVYLASVHASYARAIDLTFGGGVGIPSDDLDADVALSASWTTSPLSSLSLDSEGSLATTYGLRADSRLIDLDSFLFGQRLEYAFGHTLSFSHGPTRLDGWSLEAGYAQAGALAADSAAAVGVDSHEAHAALSWSRDIGPRDTLTPEIRYTFTHYNHALLDTDLHRGPADIHVVALSAAASHELAPGLTASVTGGLSIGDPMPLVRTGQSVIAPDVAASLRWIGRRARVDAKASYAYTSLGPRLGFGEQTSLRLKVDVRPMDGAAHRDLLLHGTLRFSRGAAPLGVDPPLAIPGMPPPPPSTGKLTTTRVAAGVRVDVPIARGFALTAGGDLGLARGTLDPDSLHGGARLQVISTLTLGIAGTVSTDKPRTFPRDPEADRDEAERRHPPETPPERYEDRTETSYEEP